MKQALLIIGAFISLTAFAQNTCNELFISEYVEGWSNNKALEIYNPTNNPIDLSGYFVSRYSNGATTATVANSIQLSGTVPAKGVFVAVLQKLDPNGTGQEAQMMPEDNINLVANAVDYLADDTGLLTLRTKSITNRPLDNVDESTKMMIKYFNVFAPILLVIFYGLFRMQRRKKQRRNWLEKGI